jgi:hypothetical protein
MGRRSRLRKAEEAAAKLYDEIALPSGEVVRVGYRDRFDALCALLNDQGERHWLAERLLEQDVDEIPEDAEDFLRVVYDMFVPAKKEERRI